MLKSETGEGHGKLVRNILEAKNEMDSTAAEKEKKGGAESKEPKESGIILGKKGKVSAASKLPSKTEINSLRNTIQELVKSSNPLGRSLEFVTVPLRHKHHSTPAHHTRTPTRHTRAAHEQHATHTPHTHTRHTRHTHMGRGRGRGAGA